MLTMKHKYIINTLIMKRLDKIFFGIVILALLIFRVNSTFAKSDHERNLTTEEITTITTKKINRKLVAEKINIKLETAKLDSIMMLFELTEEEESTLAEDLYEGFWNNQYVRAYENATIPDSFNIDLSSFTMPVEGKITSSFGQRKRRFHYGTDLKLQTGDTIVAAFEGKVRVRQYERRGYGYFLVLRHPNGLETVYGHLSKFLVDLEETVEAGQPIALGGNTGRSTGPHLHFECRFLGQAIDPAEIVDFSNFCTYDDAYVFQKSKINEVSINNSNYKEIDRTIKYHRIKSGDTLSKIAKKYGVSVLQLCRLNGIKSNYTLRIGKTIRYT